MNKIKLLMIFLVVVAIFVAVVVHATSDKQVIPKAGSEMKTVTPAVPQTKILSGSRQGYKMVAYVIDGFGSESESPNFKIPVNAGGQASAIGISQSDNFVVKVGFVYASFVNRGEVTGDGLIDLGDLLFLISYLYKGGLAPCPVEAGDVNCDGIIDLGDILYLISYLYKGGPPPA
jgi:hypothetical protein